MLDFLESFEAKVLHWPFYADLFDVEGDTLYYATSFFDHWVMDVSYSRPEAFYFWFYFVLMNFFWIAIPGGKLGFGPQNESLGR